MAEKMDSAEIEDTIRRYNEALREANYDLSKVSKTTVEEFNNAKAGIRNYTFQLNQSLKTLGQSSLALASSLAKGEQGASIYNNSIKSGADAVAAFASKFGILGTIVGSLAQLLGKYVTAASEQSDKLFAGYQQLSKIGAAGAGGLQETLDNLHQFGYTLKDLDQFAATIKANAETLAVYNGTVNQGTKAFAQVTQGFKDSGLQTQFRLLGLGIQDINQGIAGFTRIQVLSGSNQRKTTAELVQGSSEYIRQLDLLTRLTGKSAESLQAEQERNRQNAAFAVTLQEIEERAEMARAAGDTVEEKRLTDTVTNMQAIVAQVPESMKASVRGLMTGFAGSSKESLQMFLAAPGAAQQLLGVRQGLSADQGQAILEQLRSGLKETARTQRSLFQFQGRGEEIFGSAFAFGEIGEERQKALRDAEAAQRNQILTPEAGVKAQVSMRQAQESITRASEAFVNLGVKPVTRGLELLNNAINRVTETILPGSSAAGGKAAPVGRSLLDIIGRGESGGNYNALVGGGTADLTNMTIADVQKLQGTMIASGRASTAVGKYQMIRDTLAEQVKKAGLDPNTTKFDQQTQDLLASQLVSQAGLGRNDPATVMKRLAGTFASLPQDMSGRGRYDGFNTNRANINPNELMAAIQSAPRDSVSSALQGVNPSAVRNETAGTVTATAVSNARTSNDLTVIQIAKMDELIGLMKTNNSINSKILQRARG